ncbi:hypothetical protein PIB30_081747 [Stylosanthes scabra]|uniref:Uncharacterized protein n=1 Tax=Stylosanthes scabra TaxID=79078 RepID=A0ABU6YS39_9FABA|nr:hypothetical protein [Stylosanthes scabra]
MYALALKGKTSPDLLTVFSSSLTPQGNRRDKLIIEYDPEIEKTLKKNQNRVKAQRALQFEQQEANSDMSDAVNALMTQLSTINKKLEKLEASAVGTQVVCGICGGPHE